MDASTEEFSCLRESVRWPMVVNYNLINIACYPFQEKSSHSHETNIFGKVDHAVASKAVAACSQKLRCESVILAQIIGFSVISPPQLTFYVSDTYQIRLKVSLIRFR